MSSTIRRPVLRWSASMRMRNASSCHTKGLDVPLAKTCVSCHAKDNFHKGKNGTACADCHTPKAWKAVTFDHAKTDFPLKGKHGSVKCGSCHTKPVKEWVLPTTCIGCHKKDDTHKALLGEKCADCHVETGWANVRFQHERDAGFALKGKHSTATCAACHKEPTHVKAPPSSCIGCHRDDDPHKRQLGDGCGQCHGETAWKTAVRFDHDLTDFPLLGKHDGLGCVDCHATPAFLDADPVCASCHAKKDVHKGRFGPNRSTCHNPVEWTRWKFDHNTQTDYPLTGKHKQVGCESCHRNAVKGEIELSTRCVTCHIRTTAPRLVRTACGAVPHDEDFSENERSSRIKFPYSHCVIRGQRNRWSRVELLGAVVDRESGSMAHRRLNMSAFSPAAALRTVIALAFALLWLPVAPAMAQQKDEAIVQFDHFTTGFPLDGAHRPSPATAATQPGTSRRPRRAAGTATTIRSRQASRSGTSRPMRIAIRVTSRPAGRVSVLTIRPRRRRVRPVTTIRRRGASRSGISRRRRRATPATPRSTGRL